MITRRHVLLGLAAAPWATRALAAEVPLDIAYLNARVWTGRPAHPRATAFGTVGNRIAAIGDVSGIRALAGRGTRIIDLDNAFVMPGFIDNHTHFLRASFMLDTPELRDATSPDDFIVRVAESARALPPGRWLTGGNWDEQRWGGELPTRQWIDAVTPDRPVAIVRLDQHVVLLNSLALKLAGIDRHTPDPEGGLILHDADGEPNGLLKDRAKDLVRRVIPAPSPSDVEYAIRRGIAYAVSKGVTQAHVTELDWVTHDALRRMRSAGELGLRFYSLVPLEDWERLAQLVRAEGRGDDWVRWGGVKGLVDGSLGSRTALFREPYADDPVNRGIPRMPLERLRDFVLGADAAGLHVAVHAIGDLGNRQVLDLFADAVRENGARARRFRVEHAQHLDAADIPRFARQNVIASMQPYHAIDDGRWAGKPLGSGRLEGSWAARALLDSGARVTFGSDWPVAPLDPLLGVEAAAWRRTVDGANPDGWVPAQRISVEEALAAYTTANAYAGFQEDRFGALAPGFVADFVVLERDPTGCEHSLIGCTRVMATVIDGIPRFGSLQA